MQWGATAWCRDMAPLGVHTAFAADDPRLLDAALAGYRAWGETEAPETPRIEIRLTLGERAAPGPCLVRVTGSQLTLSGTGVTGEADARLGTARCIVPPHFLDDPASLVADILDPLLLFLLARTGRTPLHAAGVVIGETALLLCGASGSGKSTLALTAAGAGLPVLSDDTVYVQTDPVLRVWGFPRPIHVFPADDPTGSDHRRLRSGRIKAAVPLPASASVLKADRALLCLLDHGDDAALEPMDSVAATERLSRLEPGFDLLAADSAAAVRALAANGAWRLTLSRRPAHAIALLRDRFGDGG
ncbi:MAG: hypothetical protein JWN66_1040 [Sphingomonas bacterium]|uniref:hypothetical protein n=1 Tax=Sphingomonas bacterium TaxID=1895847 RepID=UPI00261602A8|nr:hypothetical protein [Sphingomonas bacterium]MDB5703924.1 hypothetical protein [Sphingomonas bacterium]